MIRFVAVDVETANADLASLCQIGLVAFDEGAPVNHWQSITEDMVRDAPTLPTVYEHLRAEMAGRVVVCHTAFDRLAIRQACDRYQLPPIECRWLDSARVTRRVWPEFRHKGYGLASVAKKLGIAFDHHIAKEDARAAGIILLRAVTESGLSVEEWFARSVRPISTLVPIAREGNADGPLAGEVVVFTGTLSVTRDQAATIAADLGCAVAAGVTKHTTLLVVGDQDGWKLAGHEKSSKHRKAEALVAAGQRIRIVGESDFRAPARTEMPVYDNRESPRVQ